MSELLPWFMTEAEAHKCVARWRRIMLPCRARTENQTVRNMERGAMGLVGGGLLICVTACTALQGALFWTAALFGVALSALSFSLTMRFREVRHVLKQAQIVNRQSQN